METWIIRDLLYKYGTDLCGIVILTEEVGDYTGGLAEIIDLEPDPAAPEIVFNVHRFHNNEEIVMGIFEWETVRVYNTDQTTIYSF